MADCLRHPNVETGGVLLGRIVRNDIVVPFILPAGRDAVRKPAEFAPDSSFQQHILDYLFDRFDVDYVGDWHRHPGRFDRPSHTDWVTARQIVESPEWATPVAAFPIATLAGSTVELKSYLMDRTRPDFADMKVVVVDENSRIVRSLLHHPPTRKGVPSA